MFLFMNVMIRSYSKLSIRRIYTQLKYLRKVYREIQMNISLLFIQRLITLRAERREISTSYLIKLINGKQRNFLTRLVTKIKKKEKLINNVLSNQKLMMFPVKFSHKVTSLELMIFYLEWKNSWI